MKIIRLFFLVFLMTGASFANVLIITMPKTGTNLLIKCVKLLLNTNALGHANNIKSGMALNKKKIFWAHEWKFEGVLHLGITEDRIRLLEGLGFRVLLMQRDPRDHLCSMLRAKHEQVNEFLLTHANLNPGKTLSSVASPFFLRYNSYQECYEEYYQWRQFPFAYTVRFEKLVGPKGGGDIDIQIEEVLQIARHLKISVSYDEAREVASKLFGNTPTFKNGQSGNWVQYFNEDFKKKYKELNGTLLLSLGYENDENW